jgi:hypothetical protein
MANPHPTIVFEVDLSLLSAETFGPNTNSSSQGVLNPDTFQSSPDQGVADQANRVNTRSTFIPGVNLGPNYALKHGDQFTLYGTEAIYAKKTYCSAKYGGEATSDRAILKVI